MISKAVRSKAMARTAVIGLTLGVTALAALAGYSINGNVETTRHVREAGMQSDQWGALTQNVSIEYEMLGDYLRASTDIGRQPLLSAMGSATGNIDWLTANGDETDQAEAADLADSYAAYTETLHQLVAADGKGDRTTVDALSQQASLAASTLRKSGMAQVARKRLDMDQYLLAVDERNNKTLVAAGAIVAVDMMLLILCASLMIGHQRRIERQAQESRYRAGHDGLTGLANRSLLAEHVDRTLAQAARGGDPVGLLLLDLNKFKEVNDTLGHHAGDLLLTEVAARLADAVRESDTVARLGGDEFAVLLPRVGSADDCLDLARRVLDAVQGPAELDGVQVDISGSIGAAVYPLHSANSAELLQHADIAMYTAKRTRSGTAIYDAEADIRSSEQLGVIGELHRAIAEDELVLHYQPKVATGTGELVGVEALVRWQHPARGLLPPSEFIPQAEDDEIIVALTDAILELALRQHVTWREAGVELPVAVNIAAGGLYDNAFPDRVSAALIRHDVPGAMLTLEITETSIISDPAEVQTILDRLRDLGVKLSIDDFGTGYSSMAYLQTMPLTELKIDRRFIKSVHESPSDEAIVRAILELARALNLKVVAEGVESAEALAVLETMGCPFAQGYHMSRPLPAGDVLPWAAGRVEVPVSS
ncbi:EAL domain-containing protein [Actinoplanes sp. NPDC026619]|uniref:putative bifunctional diguanylate cyclase/phosphodiesterase n=1 Tax=Actinoplanes sp. NPDC026619 TaxID=3155798 RepID=UPI0033D4F8CF